METSQLGKRLGGEELSTHHRSYNIKIFYITKSAWLELSAILFTIVVAIPLRYQHFRNLMFVSHHLDEFSDASYRFRYRGFL